jgi:hypothetical protein
MSFLMLMEEGMMKMSIASNIVSVMRHGRKKTSPTTQSPMSLLDNLNQQKNIEEFQLTLIFSIFLAMDCIEGHCC